MGLNITVATLLLEIKEIIVSNLGLQSGYVTEISCCFPQFLHANATTVHQIGPQLLPLMSFFIQHSLIIQSELLIVLLYSFWFISQ
jgi:hypothetical protein